MVLLSLESMSFKHEGREHWNRFDTNLIRQMTVGKSNQYKLWCRHREFHIISKPMNVESSSKKSQKNQGPKNFHIIWNYLWWRKYMLVLLICKYVYTSSPKKKRVCMHPGSFSKKIINFIERKEIQIQRIGILQKRKKQRTLKREKREQAK